MNIDYLKAQFPNYKITDASNRTNDEIIKISSICILKKDILVVIERNSKNNDYFDMIEMLEDIKHKKTKYIMLNDDNYYYNSSLSNSFILHVKRKLDGENECPICFEESNGKYFVCSQCASICCVRCFSKCESKRCAICRCNRFTTFGFSL